MRRARVMLAVVAMVGATSWTTMSAQIRWGNPETPREGVCFYEDADFRGRWFCARSGEDLSEMPRGMNDRIVDPNIRPHVQLRLSVARRVYRLSGGSSFNRVW